MLRLLCIGGACVALTFGVGCGDDGEDTGASGAGATQDAPAETQAETEAATTEAAEGAITVTMKDFAFDPQDVEGKVGQKVTWVNEDDAQHNAVAQNGGDLETKTFGKGGSDSYTLDEAGTIEYICTVHPQMTATIEVTE